ncbi:MAG: ABC transporter permease [Armatimonadota bacterium]
MKIQRVLRLLKKELLQTRRDKRMLAVLFFAPIFQLFVFGYAVSTDINHIATAVFDEDRTATSRALVDRMVRSGYFDYQFYLSSPSEVNRMLDTGNAQLVVHIPRGFSEDLARNRTAQLQALLDGSDSMSARVISGYLNAVIEQYSGEILVRRLERLRGATPQPPQLDARLRVWYNPELKSVNYMVPGVLSMILLIVTTMMTAMAIVKEKELGTLEQLVVTPITPSELMVGKTLPFLLIGLVDMVLVLLVAVGWFHVRVAGSIPLLFALSGFFILTSLGLGIFISTVSRTQQEAMLTSFFFMFPFILLSGFIFPIANMPIVMQWVTRIIPMRYFLEIIRGIFLKGNGFDMLWSQTLILACFGVGILTLSALRFRKRIG